VKSLVRDVSPWGAVGLAGGVREWCADEVSGKSGHRRIRGGSAVDPRIPWLANPPLGPDLFVATREDSAMQASKMNDLGFRCVLRLQAAPEAAGRIEPASSGGERKE
jgi:formylglycine-generating enzyme required for sulfatase activity